MGTVPVTFLLALLTLLTPSALRAQYWSALRKDPAVENYTLSMDKIRKFVEVQRAIVALHAKDAAEFSAIDKEFKEAQKGNATPTTADAAAIVDRHRRTLARQILAVQKHDVAHGVPRSWRKRRCW